MKDLKCEFLANSRINENLNLNSNLNLSENSSQNSLSRRKFLKKSVKFASLALFSSLNLGFASEKRGAKNIVIYYTRTLNTHILANYLKSLVGGDLLRIDTAQSYPQDYQATVALAAKQRTQGFLPPLKPHEVDFRDFDSIIIAAPLWGMDLCAPMKSFLNTANFGSKKVHFIITNAGYGLGASIKSAQKLVNVGFAMDYEFALYEKIRPNLRTINLDKIRQNTAFVELDKTKIANFVKKLKIANS